MSTNLVPVNFNPNLSKIQVIVHKDSTATFTVPDGTRDQIEKAIAERLRSDTELVWKDDSEGVTVAVISPSGVRKLHRRFSIRKDDGGEQ